MGALSQLVAVGAQDVFLTGDPQRSLWKRSGVRRTNFAIESQETVFNLIYDASCLITLARKGDLIKNAVLQIQMMKSAEQSFYPIEQFVKSVTVMIGGQDIEIIDDASTWLRVHDESFNDVEVRAANYRMLNFRPEDVAGSVRNFYLDLPLFFTRHLSNALPLVALQYHDVQLKITFNNPANIPGVDPSFTPTARLFCDYVFLDRPERTYFAQNPHEYMIEQLQTFRATPKFNSTGTSQIIDLPFNMPSRYILWVYKTDQHGVYTTGGQFETNDAYAPLDQAVLSCNGVNRFSQRPGSYFTTVQPLQALAQIPSAGIYMYSFGVCLNDQDSMGTLNFSRLDMTNLILTTKAATAVTIAEVLTPDVTLSSALTKFTDIVIFAKNFNVLRVVEGMGGLVFAN